MEQALAVIDAGANQQTAFCPACAHEIPMNFPLPVAALDCTFGENIPPNKSQIDIVACEILGFGRPCVLDFPLCEVYTLIQPMKINEGGEPLRKAHRKFLQADLLLCILSAFLVCPFGAARVAPERSAEAGSLSQIEFTPHVQPLELTQTAESVLLGPVPTVTPQPTLGPGQMYVNPNHLPELAHPHRQELPFGYSEIVGHPGLFLVWSTDEKENTRYFTISEDNKYFDEITELADNHWDERNELFDQNPGGLVREYRFQGGLGLIGGVLAGAATIAAAEIPPLATFLGAGSLSLFGFGFDKRR